MIHQHPVSTTLAAVCTACGGPLARNGACIACLIRGGLEDSAGFESEHDAAVFGQFEIERSDDGSLCELGRGAMGVTYRAVDTVLNREVALKVIEPRAGTGESRVVRERFLREARAAAALRHPNIAAVFQFGEIAESGRCYCAMELVEGETLEARVRRAGPLRVAAALEIALQVTHALIAAAERGLVHRDLKPGNIMLAAGADQTALNVKVIDFGLAKAVSAAAEMELTHGGFVGTPAFASPEQFAGGAVDARSDIYALGVTLWFTLTGRIPSAGTTIEEIRQRQASHQLPLEQLAAAAVPPPLLALLQSCLAIDPAERPSSARELMRALETCREQIAGRRRRRKAVIAIAVAAAAAITASGFLFLRAKPVTPATAATPARAIEPGVAVLPFENLSAAPEDAFFADGMQEDILTSLGRIKDLKVIARSSVMTFAGRHAAGDRRKIGEALGISHVLEGSVRRVGDRVVVSASLVDTRDERQIWADRYERTLSDALSLQGQLAQEIARALRATLTPSETATAGTPATDNPQAYLLFLRARETHLRGEDAKDLEEAARLYQQAIDLDPKFALARARLAMCLNSQFYQHADAASGARVKAEAEEALRLRPDLGEGYLAMTYWYLYQQGDLERAMAELNRAAELLPNSAEVPLTAAFIHKRQNRYRDRLAALQRAEALDPRNQVVLSFLVLTNRWVRDWPQALHARDKRFIVTGGVGSAVFSHWRRANDEFQLSGDIEVLKKAVVETEEYPDRGHKAEQLAFMRYEIAMLERDHMAAAMYLNTLRPEAFTGQPLFMYAGHEKPFYEALLAVASGAELNRQHELLDRAEQALHSASAPTNRSKAVADPRADLALIQAFRGKRESAVAEATAAVEMMAPGSIERNDISAALALVYAHVGESEKAIDLIEHLLTVPVELQDGSVYNMTLADLRWRWEWDPLRSHPRFQKLLAEPEPKTRY